jgi:hypothetical protein
MPQSQPGNNHAEYSLDEIKSLIIKYVAHINEGYSKESFVPCDYRTIESHLSKYASDLQSEKKLIEQAFRGNRLFWEEKGKKGLMVGKRFNATVWIFNMKNRFKDEWMDKVVRENNDKVDANVNHSGTIKVTFGNSTIQPPQGTGENTSSDTE